jgi:hypothetical protein
MRSSLLSYIRTYVRFWRGRRGYMDESYYDILSVLSSEVIGHDTWDEGEY